MSTVSIVYFSGSGSTGLLADAIARGARAVEGTEVKLLRITGDQIVAGRWEDAKALEQLTASDAIVFGTPTYMGGVAAQFKAFADATGGIWYTQGWKDKLAGGFTVSGSPSGDKLSTLNYLTVFAAQHGMNWINLGKLPAGATGDPEGENRAGSFIGVMAQNRTPPGQTVTLHPSDVLTAEHYGQRIAEFAQRLQAVAA